jgi:imidazolonepropionase
MRDLGIIEGGCLAVRGDRIVFSGTRKEFESEVSLDDGAMIIDASDRVVLPGFVDAHTHLAFAGSRHDEFAARLAGASYEEIAAKGGGILSTVRATRAASTEELQENIRGRFDSMLREGTTTCEAKSGYGLTVEKELGLLESVAAAASDHPIDVIGTLLGAHSVPAEHKQDRERYVQMVIQEMIPAAASAKLAKYCDVYCERSVFSIDETRRILTAGRKAGLEPRFHADQLSEFGGAQLAAELKAASADHLDFVGDEGIKALAAAGVSAGVLPGASFCIKSTRHAPARKLIDAGVPVFVATDMNPGTSYTESMQTVMSLGCLMSDMAVEEAVTAATLNAAHSLGLGSEIGSLQPGRRADLLLMEIPHYAHMIYHFGINHISAVIKGGRIVVQEGMLTYEDQED